MAINKKLISFATQAQFAAQLSAGNIDNRSIVFIEDEKRIWTHGVYFDTSWDYITGKPDDSPQDGKTYGRKDNSWTEISSGADVYDWTWLYDIYPPSGTCTQQQYNELLAAVQTGKLFPNATSVYAYPTSEEGDELAVVLGITQISLPYVGFINWVVLPDLNVSVEETSTQNGSSITKAEIEAVLTGNITSHTHAYVALSGNQTVSGTKTFGSIPVLPASNPTAINQAVRKKYVDDGLAIKLDSNKMQVVTALPASPVTGVFYFIKE